MSIRIAMWSGPRNISTALMRSWENRPDTAVWDEPFYAHYLQQTRAPHPGADEVIAHHESDWRKVVAQLVGPIPDGKTIFYQKHMTHHLLPHMERGWLGAVNNCFLIREPREMLTSLLHVLPEPTLADTGMPQQVEIFNWVRRETGTMPPVLDARAVLENPRRMLGLLCARLGIDFREEMLSWPPGRRASDGIWAKHWYDAVEKSTTFQAYKPKAEQVPERWLELCRQCEELYRELHEQRLRQS